MKTTMYMVAVALLAFHAAPAWAQEDDFPIKGFESEESEPEETEPAPVEGFEDADAEVDDGGPRPIEKARDLAAEEDADDEAEEEEQGSDQSIYVVQRRAYSKKRALEVTPFFFTKINPKFVGYLGGGLSLAFHFKENFGIEFVTAIPGPLFSAFYSDLSVEAFKYEQLTPEKVDLKRMDYFGSLSLNFSAFYGKWNLYGTLLDYDFYALGGIGVVTLEETCVPNTGDCGAPTQIGDGLRKPDSTSDRLKITGNVGFGLRVYFLDFIGLRVEFRDIVYSDRDADVGETTTDIRNELMIFLGASFLINPWSS